MISRYDRERKKLERVKKQTLRDRKRMIARINNSGSAVSRLPGS
jgi:hypothetical protein